MIRNLTSQAKGHSLSFHQSSRRAESCCELANFVQINSYFFVGSLTFKQYTVRLQVINLHGVDHELGTWCKNSYSWVLLQMDWTLDMVDARQQICTCNLCINITLNYKWWRFWMRSCCCRSLLVWCICFLWSCS